MKKTLALSIIGMLLMIVIASCASSNTAGHCDAYGSLNHAENTDLTSK
jgi:hypothetical protein